MDRRIILGEEVVADDHPVAGAGLLGDPHCSRSQLLGPHVAGRRVDQVAGEEGGPGEAFHSAAVGALGPHQRRADSRLGVVASEAIGAERPAERQMGRVGALRQRLEPIAALGQRLR